jgi:hypothetical protein
MATEIIGVGEKYQTLQAYFDDLVAQTEYMEFLLTKNETVTWITTDDRWANLNIVSRIRAEGYSITLEDSSNGFVAYATQPTTKALYEFYDAKISLASGSTFLYVNEGSGDFIKFDTCELYNLNYSDQTGNGTNFIFYNCMAVDCTLHPTANLSFDRCTIYHCEDAFLNPYYSKDSLHVDISDNVYVSNETYDGIQPYLTIDNVFYSVDSASEFFLIPLVTLPTADLLDVDEMDVKFRRSVDGKYTFGANYKPKPLDPPYNIVVNYNETYDAIISWDNVSNLPPEVLYIKVFLGSIYDLDYGSPYTVISSTDTTVTIPNGDITSLHSGLALQYSDTQ